jgi:hypothetical protein
LRIDSSHIFAARSSTTTREYARRSLAAELGEQILEWNGFDAALAIGARFGYRLALLVGLGFVIERDVVECPGDRIARRFRERSQGRSRFFVAHRLHCLMG